MNKLLVPPARVDDTYIDYPATFARKKSHAIQSERISSTIFKMSEENPNVIALDPNETWRIRKNVAVITVALMIHFTATNGAANLQSSINAEAGLGTAGLAALYTGLVISNIFLTSIVIKWLGTKMTICCSFITSMLFIAFQMYPRFSTLVPAAFLMGLASGVKYCAKNTYVAVLAEAQSLISKKPASTILLSFSGFFFMVVQLSQFWGNLISSLVLSTANNASETAINETMIPLICGSNFLPNMDAAEALPAQPPEKIQTLAGIYLACIVAAVLLIAVGLDSMKRYEFCRTSSNATLSGFALLAVTIKQLADWNQKLLLLINVFVGLQQGFFSADFTASFVSCTIGPGSVGYVMMSYGIANIVGCIVNAYLAKMFGRLPLMYCALFAHAGIFMTLLLWSPHAGGYYVLLTIAILWGLCDSIWMVQINTYFGDIFRGKEEAAFSNLGLWESVGYIISYALSSYVRTRYKVYMLLCSLIIGITGYLTVEYRQRKKDSRQEIQDWVRDKSNSEVDQLN